MGGDGRLCSIAILGFYNRFNIGDDAYQIAFNLIFGSDFKLEFYCMDDIKAIPGHIDIVICGGGDIINEYFMEKAEKILCEFYGPVYAVSVGIPYEACVNYLRLFDHVFARSTQDYEIACSILGERNVTCIRDIVWLLHLV
jgi:hypothetical protein